jgi:hypothetical protein
MFAESTFAEVPFTAFVATPAPPVVVVPDHPYYWYNSDILTPKGAPKIKRAKLKKQDIDELLAKAVDELITNADKQERARLVASIKHKTIKESMAATKFEAKAIVLAHLKKQIQEEEEDDEIAIMLLM